MTTKTPERKIQLKVGSYASVLKGREKSKMSGIDWLKSLSEFVNLWNISNNICIPSDSDKFRDLHEAIEYPPRSMFEEVQFPPVTVVRAE